MQTISQPHPYTPVVTFGTTNPTAATFTCESHSQQLIGKHRRVHCKVTCTDVGSGGAGALRVSLPSTPATNSAGGVVFSSLNGIALPANSVMVIGKITSVGVSIYGVTIAGVETALAWADLANGDVIEFIAQYVEA